MAVRPRALHWFFLSHLSLSLSQKGCPGGGLPPAAPTTLLDVRRWRWWWRWRRQWGSQWRSGASPRTSKSRVPSLLPSLFPLPSTSPNPLFRAVPFGATFSVCRHHFRFRFRYVLRDLRQHRHRSQPTSLRLRIVGVIGEGDPRLIRVVKDVGRTREGRSRQEALHR